MLRLHRAYVADVYRDIIRVPLLWRKDLFGRVIKEGSLCWVTVGNKGTYAILRGLANKKEPVVRIDDYLRDKLGISDRKIGEEIYFVFIRVGFWRELCWAITATEPSYRIMSRAAVISLVLGLVGVVFGFAGLIISILNQGKECR